MCPPLCGPGESRRPLNLRLSLCKKRACTPHKRRVEKRSVKHVSDTPGRGCRGRASRGQVLPAAAGGAPGPGPPQPAAQLGEVPVGRREGGFGGGGGRRLLADGRPGGRTRLHRKSAPGRPLPHVSTPQPQPWLAQPGRRGYLRAPSPHGAEVRTLRRDPWTLSGPWSLQVRIERVRLCSSKVLSVLNTVRLSWRSVKATYRFLFGLFPRVGAVLGVGGSTSEPPWPSD